MPAKARLCADCDHVHGGGGYGLCYTMVGKLDVCPCLVARPALVVVERQPQTPAPVRRRPPPRRPSHCERTHVRHAKVTYFTLTPEERTVLARVARRLDDTMLTLEEYAAEVGIDRRLIWRARRDLGLKPQPVVTTSLMRPQPRRVG